MVGYETDRFAVHATETDHDVPGKEFHHFDKFAAVAHRADDVAHVVRLSRVGRNDFVDVVLFEGFFGVGAFRGVFVVLRDNREQLANLVEALLFGFGEEVGVAGHFAVYTGTAELFHRDFFAQHGFNHFGPGDEHFGDFVHHEDEVREGRRVNGSPGTRPEDNRDLRNDTAGEGVSEEDFTVSGQGVHPFLDTSTARVVDTDKRDTHIEGVLHDFGNLAGVHQAERPAGYGKVLSKNGHRVSADGAGPDNHPVAGQFFVLHAELRTGVFDEDVIFVEGVCIEQGDDTLARGHFAHGFLLFDGFHATAVIDFFPSLFEVEDFFIHCHRYLG